MNMLFTDSLASALHLLWAGDRELWQIIGLSLRCTLTACFFAFLLGVPCSLRLNYSTFYGKKAVLITLNSLQAMPTVVVGLVLYMLIGRQGIFGAAGLLYSPTAIILGQTVLIFPLVTMLCLTAINRIDGQYRQTALTLGASEWQAHIAVMREARLALAAAICIAFGRGIAEVGVSMMLGGNIKHFTRTMTTAMALEYDKGEFSLALALGIVLLAISFTLNLVLHWLQERVN